MSSGALTLWRAGGAAGTAAPSGCVSWVAGRPGVSSRRVSPSLREEKEEEEAAAGAGQMRGAACATKEGGLPPALGGGFASSWDNLPEN